MTKHELELHKAKLLKQFNDVDIAKSRIKWDIKEINSKINSIEDGDKIEDIISNGLVKEAVNLKNSKISLFKEWNELFLAFEIYDDALSHFLEERDICFFGEDFQDEDYEGYLSNLLGKKHPFELIKSFSNVKELDLKDIPWDLAETEILDYEACSRDFDLEKAKLNIELDFLKAYINIFLSGNEEKIKLHEEEFKNQITICENYIDNLMDKVESLNRSLVFFKECIRTVE